MIADLISKLRVHVDHIVIERASKEAVTHQNMVESLRVAFEVVGIPFTLRQCLNQGMEDAAFQRVDRGGKVEIVQVAQDNNPGTGVQGQDAIDEIIDDLRLLIALGLGVEHGRLKAAKERIIAALGIEVIGDEK